MKSILKIILPASSAALLPLLVAADLQLQSFTIDSGGGVSSDGNLAISGTTGQPDANSLSAGNYIIEGGFWNGSQFHLEAAPRLLISKSGTDTVVTWPVPATGFLLQWAPSLSTNATWNIIPFPYATSATHISHSEPSTTGPRYYRLRK